MTAAFDPYETLGVGRDATAAQVKRAYRARAKKAHPDSGGSSEAFGAAYMAMRILSDQEKRKKFDETGEVDDSPNNTRSAALQVIQQQMSAITIAFIQSGLNPHNPQLDPRRMDVLARIKDGLKAEIAQAKTGIANGQKVVEFMRDMAGRLDGGDVPGNPLAASFHSQAAAAEGTISNLKNGILCRELALEIVAKYKFRFDDSGPIGQVMPQHVSFFMKIG